MHTFPSNVYRAQPSCVPYYTAHAQCMLHLHISREGAWNDVKVLKSVSSRVRLRERMRILLPRNTYRKKRIETPDPNNTRMPWSVPKRVPVDVPIGKRNPWVPWLLQYFLLVLYQQNSAYKTSCTSSSWWNIFVLSPALSIIVVVVYHLVLSKLTYAC